MSRSFFQIRRWLGILTLLLLATVQINCGSGGGGTTSTTTSTSNTCSASSITVATSTGQTTIAVNATVDIVATVKNSSGGVLSGVPIIWADEEGNVISISPATGTTNASGQATTTATGNSTGNEIILATTDPTSAGCASSDPGKDGIADAVFLAVSEGGGDGGDSEVNSITVLDPEGVAVTSISTDGGTLVLTATVRNAEGAAISGASISWAISDDSKASLSTTSGTTDGNGQTTTTVTALANTVLPVVVSASHADSGVIGAATIIITGQ